MRDTTRIIYAKVEDLPETRTRKAFLKNFLKALPATYHKAGRTECNANCNRSITDLISLVRSRFLKTSKERVIEILAELHNEGRCYIIWCRQVERFVVKGGLNENSIGNSKFVSNYSVQYFGNKLGNDGLGYEELMEIRDNHIGS
tara:strand:- start:64781 stop:65215 length:435 start_codon:yes stop_codon:yes gene_type:complete